MTGIVAVSNPSEEPADARVRTLLRTLDGRGEKMRIRATGTATLGTVAPRGVDAGPIRAGDTVAVLDGRIDDRQALADLAGLSSDASDPELVAAAHDEVGPAFLDRLIGDFAVVVWDERRQQLLAARDRTGTRNVSYATVDDLAIVASEPRAITDHPAVPAEINEGLLAEYLVGNVVTDDETFYEGVDRLPLGTSLVVDGDSPAVRRYWNPAHVEPDPGFESRLARLAREAVECRLRPATVPAVMMSGGLDSTAVAGIASQQRDAGRQVRAYSVVFPANDEIDERSGVTAAREAFDLQVHAIDGGSRWPLAEKTPYRLVARNHPCIDTSVANNRAIADRIDGPAVLLTGIGGNLHDGSRTRYADLLGAGSFRGFCNGIYRDPASTAGLLAVHGLGAAVSSRWTFLNELQGRIVGPPWPPLVEEEFLQRVGLRDRLAYDRTDLGFDTLWQKELYYELSDPYVDHALSGVRQVCLRNGVARLHPFLDARVVELLFSMPTDRRMVAGEYKQVFRRSLADILPESIRETSTTDNDYNSVLRRGLVHEEREYVRELLLSGRLVDAGYVDGTRLEQLLLEGTPGAEELSLLWRLLTAELFVRNTGSTGG